MKKLDYIIIGAQKGGTTSAISHFNQHPDLFLYPSELHFFDKDHNFKLGYDHYHSFFHNKQNKLIGEKTPSYAYQQYCIDRIYDYNSNVKLIYFLRNPITRAYSEWNMHKNLGKTHMDFLPSIEEDMNTKLCEIKSTGYHAFSRGLYYEHINYILTKFDKDNLYISISERVKANPKDEYNKIFNFLGVNTLDDLKFDESVHKGQYKTKMNQSDYDYLKKVYDPHNQKLFDFLGYNIPEWG